MYSTGSVRISGHSTMYMQMATEHLDGISVGFN